MAPPDPRVSAGRVLALGYGFFTVAAGARSGFQLASDFRHAPLAYTLSAVAAATYLAGTVLMVLTERIARHRTRAIQFCLIELGGVVAVGTASVLVPSAFPEATVWSGFGSGYAFVPVLLPLLALTWLRYAYTALSEHPAAAGTPAVEPYDPRTQRTTNPKETIMIGNSGPRAVHTSDVVFNSDTLACLARTTVARGREGTMCLPVGRPGRTLEFVIGFDDDDGEPILSATGLAARLLSGHGNRPLALRIPAPHPHTVGVILIGRLAGPQQDVRDQFVAALRVERVLADCPYPAADPGNRVVELNRYASATPLPFRANSAS